MALAQLILIEWLVQCSLGAFISVAKSGATLTRVSFLSCHGPVIRDFLSRYVHANDTSLVQRQVFVNASKVWVPVHVKS